MVRRRWRHPVCGRGYRLNEAWGEGVERGGLILNCAGRRMRSASSHAKSFRVISQSCVLRPRNYGHSKMLFWQVIEFVYFAHLN